MGSNKSKLKKKFEIKNENFKSETPEPIQRFDKGLQTEIILDTSKRYRFIGQYINGKMADNFSYFVSEVRSSCNFRAASARRKNPTFHDPALNNFIHKWSKDQLTKIALRGRKQMYYM